MSSILTSVHQETSTAAHPHPLLSVLEWEFRRFSASRLFWLQAFGLFCFLLALTWLAGTAMTYSTRNADGFIPGTSTWGLLLTLPTTVLLLVLVLPFVTADGVTRELTRRTHELLMTTSVPSWAYVLGRYLMGLLMSLGLAVLLLAAILGMGLLQHLTVRAYPLPPIDAVLLLWVGMVVPATVLVSSVGFTLSTLLPHLTSVIKIALLAGWVVGAEVLPALIYFPLGPTKLPTWYSAWDPTSAVTALVMFAKYSADVTQQTDTATSSAQLQQILNSITSRNPDISAWFAPHLIEAGLSLVLVALSTMAFQRFRNALGA